MLVVEVVNMNERVDMDMKRKCKSLLCSLLFLS